MEQSTYIKNIDTTIIFEHGTSCACLYVDFLAGKAASSNSSDFEIMTGKNNAMSVFKTVFEEAVNYAKKYSIPNISIEGAEKKRQRVYTRLLKRAGYNINFFDGELIINIGE